MNGKFRLIHSDEFFLLKMYELGDFRGNFSFYKYLNHQNIESAYIGFVQFKSDIFLKKIKLKFLINEITLLIKKINNFKGDFFFYSQIKQGIGNLFCKKPKDRIIRFSYL